METEFENSVVADAISPFLSSLDDAGLEKLVQFRADAKTQQRFDRLSEKASDGTLTPAEEQEYRSVIGASTIVAVMQAEAEKLLAEHQNGSK